MTERARIIHRSHRAVEINKNTLRTRCIECEAVVIAAGLLGAVTPAGSAPCPGRLEPQP